MIDSLTQLTKRFIPFSQIGTDGAFLKPSRLGRDSAVATLYGRSADIIQKYVAGIDTKFIYDGANVLADYDSSNNLQASYITPFLDQNLIIITNSNTYYYFQDGLGSVRNLLDSSQAVQNSYDYFAFGEIFSERERVPNRYKFTAREHDAESNTNFYRIRSNDPRIGRFLQPDPLGITTEVNLYTYVRNNAVNFVDPTGLSTAFFVTWYYSGHGKLLDIGVYSLLDDYKRDKTVVVVIEGAKLKIKLEATKLSVQCVKSKTFSVWDTEEVYVTTIYVLAEGSLNYSARCDYKVEKKEEPPCKCQKTQCTISFWFRDSFEDPLDLGIEIGGIPYPIMGSWSEDFSFKSCINIKTRKE